MRRHFALAVAFAAVSLATPAFAGPATEQVRGQVEQFISVVRDPALQGDDKAPQRQAAIRRLSDQLFDYREISKQSLGRHWEGRTAAERTEFVALFTDLLQRTYLSKVDQGELNEVTFDGETVDGDRAVVQSRVKLRQGSEMPLTYHVIRTGGNRWKVYDLDVAGVSLAANYRSQFNRIVRTTSFDDLMAKLRVKNASFSGPAASPRAPGRD